MSSPAAPPPERPAGAPFGLAPDLSGIPARYWWVLLVAGILAIVGAILVLVWPGRTPAQRHAPQPPTPPAT